MQRVRIGLTGLGFVFLAVLLAAIFTGHSQNDTRITPNLIDQQSAGSRGASPALPEASQPAEPLAQLGVAPGNADANAAAAPPPATPGGPAQQPAH